MGKRTNRSTVFMIFIVASFAVVLITGCIDSGKKNDQKNQSTAGGPDAPPAKVEILGKDIDGHDIIKKTYFTEDSETQITVIENAVISGTIYALGDAFFTELALVTKDKEYYFFPEEDKSKFWQDQEKTITVKCRIEKRFVKSKKIGRTLTKNWLFPKKITN